MGVSDDEDAVFSDKTKRNVPGTPLLPYQARTTSTPISWDVDVDVGRPFTKFSDQGTNGESVFPPALLKHGHVRKGATAKLDTNNNVEL